MQGCVSLHRRPSWAGLVDSKKRSYYRVQFHDGHEAAAPPADRASRQVADRADFSPSSRVLNEQTSRNCSAMYLAAARPVPVIRRGIAVAPPLLWFEARCQAHVLLGRRAVKAFRQCHRPTMCCHRSACRDGQRSTHCHTQALAGYCWGTNVVYGKHAEARILSGAR